MRIIIEIYDLIFYLERRLRVKSWSLLLQSQNPQNIRKKSTIFPLCSGRCSPPMMASSPASSCFFLAPGSAHLLRGSPLTSTCRTSPRQLPLQSAALTCRGSLNWVWSRRPPRRLCYVWLAFRTFPASQVWHLWGTPSQTFPRLQFWTWPTLWDVWWKHHHWKALIFFWSNYFHVLDFYY